MKYTLLKTATAAAALATAAPAAIAESDHYVLDMTHTDIHFSVMRFGFNRIIGHFRDAEGSIHYDADDVTRSRVAVTIDAASLDSGDATRDEHLNGDFWLNTDEHPEITFTATEIATGAGDTLTVTGDLSILGNTVPVVLDVTINRIGIDPATRRQAIGVTARGIIDRTRYGIATAPKLIANDVQLHIEALGLIEGD